MKAKKPSEMTNEELLKSEKTAEMTIYALLIITVVSILAVVLFIVRKGISGLIVLPFSMVTFIIINSNSLKEIRREISLRGL